jgi:transcriptional regulator
MYIPKKFEITDKNNIDSFIRANAFAQITSIVDGQLFSSHLPFLLSDDGKYLHCHLAKKNPQWEGIEGQQVLITFSGPHDYISPSWYQSKGVPTWNYQAVHVYATPKIITETEKLMDIVNHLTRIYEESFQQPWQPEYNQTMMKAIVGIELEIKEVQAQYKLSQNRSEIDQQQVIQQLDNRGSLELSHAMKQEKK